MGNPFATPDPNRDKNDSSKAEPEAPSEKESPSKDEPRNRRSGSSGSNDPRKPVSTAALRSSMTYLLVLMAAIFMVTMTFPWNIAGGIAAIAAIIMGIRILVRSRDPKFQGISRFMTVITIGMASFALIIGLGSLVLIGPQIEAQKCMSEAITLSSKRTCQAEYKRAQTELIERFVPSSKQSTKK